MIDLIPFFLLFAIGLCKLIADTIKVPEVFNSSWFIKYKNHQWLDPKVSHVNQHKLAWFYIPIKFRIFGIKSDFKIPIYAYPITVHFSDLWHFCNLIQYSCWIILALTYRNELYDLNDVTMFFIMFCTFTLSFEWWRKIFIPKK